MSTCRTCDRVFKSEEALQQHLRDSPIHTTTLDSKICDRAFKSEEALQQQLRDSPIDTMTFDCRTCDRTFKSKEALQQHFRDSPIHTMPLESKICDRAVKSKEALQQPLRDLPIRPMKSNCKTCDRAFKSKEALQHHLRESPVHKMPLDRKICDRAVKSEEALQQSLRDSPVDTMTFDCKTCDRAFKSEGALQQHLQDSPVHTRNEEATWSMHPLLHRDVLQLLEPKGLLFDFCEAGGFQDSPIHATTFDCETCDRAFKSEGALQQHLRESPVHTQETCSMHPLRHEDVLRLLEPEGLLLDFYEGGGFQDCIKSYDTHIMGLFSCSNRACPKKWSSRKIAISIRLYGKERYNAVVWHQHCQGCGALGKPILDDTYAERVAYRLKWWYGVEVEVPDYFRKSKGPHHRKLCEGCKAGHCEAGLATND